MGDAARELGETRGMNLPQAVAVVSEAVWWVTMVHATVVRHHANAYDRVLTGLDPSWRRAAEETLGASGSSGTGWATTPTRRRAGPLSPHRFAGRSAHSSRSARRPRPRVR